MKVPVLKHCLALFVLLLGSTTVFHAWAQLSSGGYPLDIPTLKSADAKQSDLVFYVDSVDINRFETSGDSTLKRFRFAYPIETCLNLNNSGTWQKAGDYRVWSIKIVAPEALSVGLLFSSFNIPEGARMFVFDEDKSLMRGAYTSQNVQPHGKFAFMPLSTDKIVVQYEEPIDASFSGSIEIEQVSYGFKSYGNERRPFGSKAGSCNINVSCDSESNLANQARAVCRILAHGTEFSTGTLINNTANDGKAYLLAAFHAFDNNEKYAETAVFLFGYESPNCSGFDGDNYLTLSGAKALAWNDSLDFVLLELNDVPPAYFRPYYIGWDHSGSAVADKHVIHHPWGDVKKISYDKDYSNKTNYQTSGFYPSGFWKIQAWDSGTTEAGSSGSSLINADGRSIGTLTGGIASCSQTDGSDYFSRFDLQWDTYEDEQSQLKVWLDPINSGVETLDGLDPYFGNEANCILSSNFKYYDEYNLVSTGSGSSFYTGNNNLGITNLAERFDQTGISTVVGISLGVAKLVNKGNDLLQISIRKDISSEDILSTQTVPLSALVEGAMNYISFETPIVVTDSFFVDIALPQNGDTLQLYQSNLRDFAEENSLYLQKNGSWIKATSEYGTIGGTFSLMLQAVLCGERLATSYDSLLLPVSQFAMYPNPTNLSVKIEFDKVVDSAEIEIYNMRGVPLYTQCIENQRLLFIDLSRFLPGIYFVRIGQNGANSVKKLVVKR